MTEDIGNFIMEYWRTLCDNGSEANHEWVMGYLQALLDNELISSEQHELWTYRIKACPGHESPRDWCSYCGNVKEEWEEWE